MDWEVFKQPPVEAAIIAGVVAIIVLISNAIISIMIHKQKLKADEALAERKFIFDVNIAEKKLSLDRRMAEWKRKTELAEHTIADFYKARDIFSNARNGFSMPGEGSTRPRREGEQNSSYKDSVYTAFERLMSERDFLNDMTSRRYRFMALFGSEVEEQFLVFVRAFNRVSHATGYLLSDRQNGRDTFHESQEAAIGWGLTEKDEITDSINEAVAKVEGLCRPILNDTPS